MSALDFGLEMVGMPEATIQELDKQLPTLGRIEAAFEKLGPDAEKLLPDLVAVLPLLRMLIAFAKAKQAGS